ncbi:MAG: NAD-dependent epimerase/dehydratase family protein [Burkholderiales bacterium]
MSNPARARKHQWAGSRSSGVTLITGGAGFVGANLAHRLLSEGRRVLIFDNLSRPGVEQNVQWLKDAHGDALEIAIEDIRDRPAVARAVEHAGHVFHFAAQVAVTTSLADPMEDFSINAGGTLNVLEAARAQPRPPGVVMTSTNKVYGALEDVALERGALGYAPVDTATRTRGISERRPLDFHSPYGCSKGTADQYVRDYSRSYGLSTIVFRMSCVYGPRQFGTEDQGWVAHFLLRAIDGTPITLYGDGHQVRDILFIDDLVDAFMLAERHIDRLTGQAFNIGGGPPNTINLLDLLERIEHLHGKSPHVAFERWRTGDQRFYVSDTQAFHDATGWKARVHVDEGIKRLYRWLLEARSRRAARVAAPAYAQRSDAEILNRVQGAR